MEKILYTNDLIALYNTITSNEGYSHNANFSFHNAHRTFDFNNTNLPLDIPSMHMISTIFPHTRTLKMTIKPEFEPEEFLLTALNQFTNLKSTQITITDGIINFRQNQYVETMELKLYFQNTTIQKKMAAYFIDRIINLKSLTVSEGNISEGFLTTLETTPLYRLSLKNPTFSEDAEKNFNTTIKYLPLQKLKLIVTYIPNQIQLQFISTIILTYLTELPHTDLRELSFTLPRDKGVDYVRIIEKLPFLHKLRIFIQPLEDFENIQFLHPLFQESLKRGIELHIVYIILQHGKAIRRVPIDREYLYKFNNIGIFEKINPYMRYSCISKNYNNRSIADYRRKELERKKQRNCITPRTFYYTDRKYITDTIQEIKLIQQNYEIDKVIDEVIQEHQIHSATNLN